MTNLFTLPWRKPFTIVFHSDAVWRWVTRACTTDREGFNRCVRKLYKHTRPDNRVTFVIFHARRREQIRHDAIPPFFHDAHSLFFPFFLSFRAIKFLLACPWKQALARTIHKHTRAQRLRSTFDFFNQRSFLPSSRVTCLHSLPPSVLLEFIYPREKDLGPFEFSTRSSAVQGFPFNGDEVSVYGSKYDTFLLSTVPYVNGN